MAIEKITVPDLGDTSEVEVIELLVAVGDSVQENDSLLVLESDKAAMEIPAPVAGIVKSIEINLGDQVSTGSPILTLETEASASSDAPEPPDPSAEDAAPETSTDSAGTDPPGTESTSTDSADTDSAVSNESPANAANGEQGVSSIVDVPDIGTDDEVDVIEVYIHNGDTVAVDDPLITLESDKAAMDVPAPLAGTVEEVLLKVGDKVRTGSAILKIHASPASEVTPDADSADPEPKPEPKPEPTSEPEHASDPSTASPAANKAPGITAPAVENVPSQSSSAASGDTRVYAGPAVRKLARELGVDLTLISGSGARGRIIKDDVQEFVKSRINAPASGMAVSAIPDIDFSRFGEVEQLPRSKLHKVTAVNMQRNWSSVPHVAQFNEADVTELEAFRAELKPEAERKGVKLTFLPFLLKACAKALQQHPQFNVSLHSSGEYLVQKKYIHIGMAVATKAGLVVPVIRDVDKKSIWELAEEVIELSVKARDRKLSMEDMQGACFTISSLGAIGGTGFIPIINAPEVAILGVAKTAIKPVYMDGEFQPRKVLPLTLSYDHKAVNGVDGGQFADYLVKVLADIRYLVL